MRHSGAVMLETQVSREFRPLRPRAGLSPFVGIATILLYPWCDDDTNPPTPAHRRVLDDLMNGHSPVTASCSSDASGKPVGRMLWGLLSLRQRQVRLARWEPSFLPCGCADGSSNGYGPHSARPPR